MQRHSLSDVCSLALFLGKNPGERHFISSKTLKVLCEPLYSYLHSAKALLLPLHCSNKPQWFHKRVEAQPWEKGREWAKAHRGTGRIALSSTQTASNSTVFSSAVWELRNPEQCFGFSVKLLGNHLETCSGFGALRGGRPRPQRYVESKSSEDIFVWGLKEGPQGAGSKPTLPDTVTCAKKTLTLASVYGEIQGWPLRL